jgi:hypothetical protein
MPDRRAALRDGVGRLIDAPPASFDIVETCGRVAAVRIIPQRIVDPVVPVALCEMTEGHWWAMRGYWRALLRAVDGGDTGPARRWARVVLRTLDGLTMPERAFFTAHLWGAFNGEAL